MKKRTLKSITSSLSVITSLALVLGTFGFALGVVAPAAFAATAPTTGAATSITTNDATLNGTNGDTDATDSSFWVSTSTFSTATPTLPAGVYSTADLGAQDADGGYSAALSSTVGLPAVTPDTTYYYAAWTEVGGTWSPGSIVQFTTLSSPTITNVSPASGTTAGGTSITITGTDFNIGATVMIGGAAATNVVVASSTAITATTPAGTSGPQDVTVTNTDTGTVTSTGGFTYVTPVATSPTTLPATAITSSNATLNGLNGSAAATDSSFWVSTSTFSTASSAALPTGVYSTPLLGAQGADAAFSAALSSVSGLPAVTPSTTYFFAAWTEVGGTWSPGAVLSFSTAAATAAAPTVTSIAPTTGTTTGGTSVTITGTGFTGATAVDFGGVVATNVTASTTAPDTSITATSPATTTAGIVDVTVTTPGGTSATSSADHFTYEIGGTVTGGTQPGGTLAVTSITPVQTSGTADNTYADGWSYIFNITVPTSEPNLSMMFSNWLDSASDTIPVAGNMQISSAQAANTAPVTITAANTYSSPPLDMIGNLSTSTPGLHVQVLVQVKLPVNTVNGSYTTNYGVQTLP